MPTFHTRRLFIEETTPSATGPGTREVWEPSEQDLLELGWVRLGLVPDPAPQVVDINPPQPLDAPVNGILKPCPVHTVRPYGLCGSCAAWANR
jgi:hypothetical protein